MQSDYPHKEKTPQQALETLKWLCSKMERCESDVRRSLYRWHVPREEWGGIIEKLVQMKFVDNERYASCYVRSKISGSGWGAAKIINALRIKGIDREIINSAIEEYVDPEQMNAKLQDFIGRRIERDRIKSKSNYDLRCRLFRAAMSRGFDTETINTVINRLISEDDHE